MKCPKCQFDNREEAKFCKKCGAKLEQICPQCSISLTPDSLFCDKCGSHLQISKKDFDQISESDSFTLKRRTKKPSTDAALFEGERKHVTVLFSDLTGYTTMSEKLDPEEVKEITGRIFGEISKIIEKYDGFIEKYAGDAVMALFGVPKAHEDDPVRAVKSAREIHELVDGLSPELEKRIGHPISMHTGINTGLVVTGELNLARGTHGVAGDTINLASRLSNLAKPGEILMDIDTCRQAEGHFECEYLEETTVKGKADPVQVHKVLSQRDKPVTIRRLSGLRADLVGRKVEMDELAKAIEDLHEGKGRVFSISGDAGTGKSRLVEEFKATLDLREIQWLEGHAYAYAQNIPYFPMIDLLSRVFDIKEGDPAEGIKEKIESGLEQLLDNHKDVIPYVGGLYSLSYPEVEEVSPEFWKSRLQEAIQSILKALAEKGPTVFFLEDLHWADPSFVELMRHACLEISQPAIVLCVYRPSFSLFRSGQLSSIGKLYHEIKLQDLQRSEALEMVQSLLKTDKVPADLQRFIQVKMEGNPFYLEEAINTLIESNTLVQDNSQWRITKQIDDADISSTVQGVITARVDRLEREAKRILQEASVIGRSFYYEILKRITELKANLSKNLGSLEHLDLINTKSIEPDLEYLFKHALTQEVVYNGLLKKERREIHERIGSVIEELFNDRLPEFYETLAFHFKRSRSVQKAVEYLKKSGEKSLTRYALEESHQYYQEAYDLLVNQPRKKSKKNELRIDLLNKWALVYYYRGDFRSFANLFEENVAIADSVDNKFIKGMFYAWLGAALTPRKRFRESLQYFQRALKIGEDIQDKKLIGFVCSWLPWTYTSLGLLDDAIVYGKRAQDTFKSLPSEHYLFFKSLAGLGWTYFYRGEKKKVLDVGRRLVEFGRQHSNIRCQTLGLWVLGLGHALNGDLVKSIEYMKRSIQTAADPFYAEFPRSFLGVLYVFNNQWKEAENSFKKTLQFCKDFGVAGPEIWANIFSGVTHVAGGQMNKGIYMIKETRKSLIEDDLDFLSAFAEYALGSVYLQMVEKSEPVSLPVVLKNIGFILKTLPFASKKAENHLLRVIEIAKSNGASYFLGLAYMDLGRLYKMKKRTEEACDRLVKAIKIFNDCEMEGFSNQAKDALESLS